MRLRSGTSYHLASHAAPLFPSTEIQLDMISILRSKLIYQEIGKKGIEDLEKESSKHKMLEQNYISKIPKSVD